MRTFKAVSAAIMAITFAAPAASQAAVTVGSNLAGDGADNLPGYCPGASTCTGTNLSLPAGSTAADGLSSPIDGVIVGFAVKSGSAGNPVKLRVLRPAGGASYTGVATGATGTTTAGVAEFSAQTRIKAGDSVGLDIGNSALVWATTPSANGLVWGSANGFMGGLADGATAAGAAQGSRELLVQARIEPDADDDGLGDETQDPCPTQAGPVCADPDDTTAPVISNAMAKPKKLRKRRATTVSYDLSEAATVTLEIQRRRKGGKRRTVRTLTQAGAEGANNLLVKRLRRGRYRVLLTAVDGAGNESVPAKARFRKR